MNKRDFPLKPEAVPADWQDAHDCIEVLRMLDRIGDKWTIMAVGVLASGTMRFNALLREIDGISHRMLTLILRGLEEDGLIAKIDYRTVPPKVEYSLTQMGRSLIQPLGELARWVAQNRSEIDIARTAYSRKN